MSNTNIYLEGIFKPYLAESIIHDVAVMGNIPKELHGTFYRNGPNPQYIYSNNYHMYEGDGMLHALVFNNGKVNYQNKWIRTERFHAERKAGKALFGGMRDGHVCDQSVKDLSRNTANTNIIWHHQKLLALNEGALPVEMQREKLDTIGNYYFGQNLDRSMMAHPKIDYCTGEIFFYSYFSSDLNFMYYIADKNGQITHRKNLTMPYLSLMHDFAITENYVIFPVFPLTWDFQRISRGEPFFKWQPGLNTRFGVMPRYGNDDQIIWFEDKACLAMHVVNAYESNNEIILEMVSMNDVPDNAIAFADDKVTYRNYFTRWVFNLNSKKITKQNLDNINTEFPRIDERFIGRQHDHAFMAATTENSKWSDFLFNAIAHYDTQNQKQSMHIFGDDALVGEPIFVPKSKNSPKGEGFILTYVYRVSEDRSDCVILDAQHIENEPLAIVQLPHRVPFGFHGCWAQGF